MECTKMCVLCILFPLSTFHWRFLLFALSNLIYPSSYLVKVHQLLFNLNVSQCFVQFLFCCLNSDSCSMSCLKSGQDAARLLSCCLSVGHFLPPITGLFSFLSCHWIFFSSVVIISDHSTTLKAYNALQRWCHHGHQGHSSRRQQMKRVLSNSGWSTRVKTRSPFF